jgi:hypothetical protein
MCDEGMTAVRAVIANEFRLTDSTRSHGYSFADGE